MGSLRGTDSQTRPTEVLDLTRVTVEACRPVVPPFEAAFQAQMAEWRLDGPRRPARRYTTSQNCPLPTPEDRLWFLLVYLQTSPLQGGQGRLFGLGQSKAHQGLHLWLVVLQATRRTLGEAPTRSLTAGAMRSKGAEADAAALGVAAEGLPTASDRPAGAPAAAPASPLVATLAAHGVSSAPRSRRNKRAVIAGRKRAPPATRCG